MNHKALSVFDYSGNKLCDLYDNYTSMRGQAFDITISNELNGQKKMSFKLPYMIDETENFRWNFVRGEYLIRVMDGNKKDWYIINEPQHTKNSTINMTVECPHVSTL